VVQDDPAPVELGLEVREQRTVARRQKTGFGYGFVHERAIVIMNEGPPAL
jgi:hypothetical protein